MKRVPTPLLPCHWHWIASSTLELLNRRPLARAELLEIFGKAPLSLKEGGYLLLLHRLEKSQYLERRSFAGENPQVTTQAKEASLTPNQSTKEWEENTAVTRYFISEKGKNALKTVTLQRQLLQAFLQPYLSPDQP
ncbi:MAG: hypothetical protein ACXIT9_10820 [Nitritalea sp.]